MFLSENTVKAYMQIIFRKLNIDNCVRAAVYARELGLDK
ncbi:MULTISPECIES: helix-turn-helix transcriptional regulator [Eikenella]|nr:MULTISPECIES: LuxR C-terminal-related transcriptional regulator [Eikenella]